MKERYKREHVRFLTFNQNCARERVLNFFYKGVLLLAKSLLIDESSLAQNIGGKILNVIDLRASACQSETLHVSPLGTAKSQDTLLSKHVQCKRINASLIDNQEMLVGGVANLF